VQLEELCKLKNPMTSSGIEPKTFQLVAQCLIQLRYRMRSINVLNKTLTYWLSSLSSGRKGGNRSVYTCDCDISDAVHTVTVR
jgi:hypothetical protein